jgi:hypothetical protein
MAAPTDGHTAARSGLDGETPALNALRVCSVVKFFRGCSSMDYDMKPLSRLTPKSSMTEEVSQDHLPLCLGWRPLSHI